MLKRVFNFVASGVPLRAGKPCVVAGHASGVAARPVLAVLRCSACGT